jgi:lipoate-protein ligase B
MKIGEPFRILRLGRVAYDDALALQEALLEQRQRGEIPDTVLLLEHPHVVTLGRRGDAANILLDEDALRARDFTVRRVGRGGDVTYHGPGQLVGYWICALRRWNDDVGRFVRAIEESLIRALSDFGVEAIRIPKLTGVWCPAPGAQAPEKIASIGVGIRRWVSWHGFALNVATDLSCFDAIVPCGLTGKRMTSLSKILGRPVSLEEAMDAVARALPGVLGGPLLSDGARDLRPPATPPARARASA